MTNGGTKLLTASAVAAGLALAIPAGPAAAGPDASGRFGLEVVDVDEVNTEQNFCGITGLTVEVHEVLHGRGFFTFRGRDSIPYFTGTFHDNITFTELDGTTVTLTSTSVNKDQRIVDNGDGTFTITFAGAGGFRLIGPSETLRNPGRSVSQVIVKTYDPQNPFDDEFVEGSFEVVRPSTGLTETGDDFCSDYLVVTGRAPVN